MTFTHSVASNNFGCAKWIVSPNVYEGTHTTVQAAINSASSGDTIFIRPSTYTEAITLKAGVNLCAYDCDAQNNVIISGTCTLTAAGTVSISGIRLQTNSAALLAVTGSAASIVTLTNCYLNCTNNTGITLSASNTGAAINLFKCNGDLGTTGIAIFSHSSTGNLTFDFCRITNSGASTTASTASAGSLNINYSFLSNPITTSSTNAMTLRETEIDTVAINTTGLTTGGSGAQSVLGGVITSGSASAVSVGSATSMIGTGIGSSNTNPITGASTLSHSGLSFSSALAAINTTTITNLAFGRTGTWTPGIAFGGSATGITYGTQSGQFCQIGNVVYLNCRVVLTSKGVQTGAATLTGLPIQSGANTYADIACSTSGVFTLTATYTNIAISIEANATTGLFFMSANSAGGAIAQVTNAMFANTSQFSFSGFYLVA